MPLMHFQGDGPGLVLFPSHVGDEQCQAFAAVPGSP
jgi:hypothetical protein